MELERVYQCKGCLTVYVKLTKKPTACPKCGSIIFSRIPIQLPPETENLTPKEAQKMNLKQAMEIVVAYLDAEMEKSPSQELANTSNYLQALLDKEKS